MSHVKPVSCCIRWCILTFKTRRPVFCPWAHASVAQALGVWSESFWALKRSMPILGASDGLLLSIGRCVAAGLGRQGHHSQGKGPWAPISLPSHPPQGRGRLIRIRDVMSITIGCFLLLLVLWQFSGSASYIYIKGGQGRWEMAPALRVWGPALCSRGSGSSKQWQLFSVNSAAERVTIIGTVLWYLVMPRPRISITPLHTALSYSLPPLPFTFMSWYEEM